MKKANIISLTMMIIIAAMFTGCAKKGVHVGVSSPTEEDFSVVFLFEYEGIQIYRFYDAGEYRYFSLGNGEFIPQKQQRTTRSGNTTIIGQWVDGVNKK